MTRFERTIHRADGTVRRHTFTGTVLERGHAGVLLALSDGGRTYLRVGVDHCPNGTTITTQESP